MVSWRCLKSCGACCYLEPSERPDLDSYLSAEELTVYLNLVGEDGWCIYFDHQQRECSIYSERPRFCRVKPDIFEEMYGVTAADFDDFAITCCLEQIEGIYGSDSSEIFRYQDEVIIKPQQNG